MSTFILNVHSSGINHKCGGESQSSYRTSEEWYDDEEGWKNNNNNVHGQECKYTNITVHTKTKL